MKPPKRTPPANRPVPVPVPVRPRPISNTRPRRRKPLVRLLVFGIPYVLIVSVISLIGLAGAVIGLAAGLSGAAHLMAIMGGQLLYTILTGVQCIRGQISGVWMGVGHMMFVGALVWLLGHAGNMPVAIVWATLGLLSVLAVVDIWRYYRKRAMLKRKVKAGAIHAAESATSATA